MYPLHLHKLSQKKNFKICEAYGKAGNGNQAETGNGNWELKTEMETNHLAVVQS